MQGHGDGWATHSKMQGENRNSTYPVTKAKEEAQEKFISSGEYFDMWNSCCFSEKID